MRRKLLLLGFVIMLLFGILYGGEAKAADQGTVKVEYLMLDAAGQSKKETKVFNAPTTYKKADIFALCEKNAPQAIYKDPQRSGWNGSITVNYDEEIWWDNTCRVSMREKYDGKTWVSFEFESVDRYGDMVGVYKEEVWDNSAKISEVVKRGNQLSVKPEFAGWKFTGWECEDYSEESFEETIEDNLFVSEDEYAGSDLRVRFKPQADNCLVRYWFYEEGPDGKGSELIKAEVVNKGTVIHLPSSMGSYTNLKWSSGNSVEVKDSAVDLYCEGERKAIEITSCAVSGISSSYVYSGKEICPTVTVKHGSKILKNGTDYTVSYSDNINVGTAKVVITGKGDYAGSITMTFLITKKNQVISASNITKTIGDKSFYVGAKRTVGNGTLSYTSSNPKVAIIASNGKITLKGTGTTNITIRAGATSNYNAASKTIKLTVKPRMVNSIKLSAPSTKIAAGKKVKLTAQISPAYASDKGLKWKSSNTKVAKVDSKGNVTFSKKAGGKKVTITAYAKDGSGKKKSYKFTVMKGSVKKVSISGVKSVKAGKSLKLKAKVSASKGANKKMKWKSSNTKFAKVSSSGKVTTYKKGRGKKVKITVYAVDGSNKKKTVTIKIK